MQRIDSHTYMTNDVRSPFNPSSAAAAAAATAAGATNSFLSHPSKRERKPIHQDFIQFCRFDYLPRVLFISATIVYTFAYWDLLGLLFKCLWVAYSLGCFWAAAISRHSDKTSSPSSKRMVVFEFFDLYIAALPFGVYRTVLQYSHKIKWYRLRRNMECSCEDFCGMLVGCQCVNGEFLTRPNPTFQVGDKTRLLLRLISVVSFGCELLPVLLITMSSCQHNKRSTEVYRERLA